MLYYNQDILTLLALDPNRRYLPLDDLCATLDIPTGREEQRVEAHTVLRAGSRWLATDDDETEQLCLRVDLVPLWLSGVEASEVDPELRPQLRLFQREVASVLWQAFRPQGFGSEDELLPERFQQTPAETAYVGELGVATLARQQILIERQIDTPEVDDEDAQPDWDAPAQRIDDPGADLLARAVRRVALAAAERTRRNEYPGVFSGLFRQFGIGSYRRTPPARLAEALEWLERWRGDLMGEPEPPPDI